MKFRSLMILATLALTALPAVAQPGAPYAIAAAKDFNWQVVIGDTGSGRKFTPAGSPGGGVKIAGNIVLPSGQSGRGVWVTPTFTTFTSGTTAEISGMLIDTPAITSSGATITNAANLKIAAAPSAGSNNYSLWVVGASRFDAGQTVTGTYTSSDATTPSFILSAGSTNTGKVVINGKTSGSTSYTTADATAQAVTITTAAQTVGASTVTFPNNAGVSSNVVLDTLAQTLTNKTLTSPTIQTGYTISGTGTIATGATITTPVFPTGGVSYTNATSGSITVIPPTGALGTPTLQLPAFTSGGGLPVAIDCGSTGSGNQTCTPTTTTGKTMVIAGHSTLSANAAVITLPASASFTSTTTYDCVGNDITTRANPVQVVPTSGATFTITNTTGMTDVIAWVCVGN